MSQPLLGGDCLAQHNLLIDIARRRLVSADTFNSIQLQTHPVYQLKVCPTPNEQYSDIITYFADVFRQQHTAKPMHCIFLPRIPTSGPLYTCASDVSIHRNSPLLKQHSMRWNPWVYALKHLAHGLPHCTWSLSRTEAGGHGEINVV